MKGAYYAHVPDNLFPHWHSGRLASASETQAESGLSCQWGFTAHAYRLHNTRDLHRHVLILSGGALPMSNAPRRLSAATTGTGSASFSESGSDNFHRLKFLGKHWHWHWQPPPATT